MNNQRKGGPRSGAWAVVLFLCAALLPALSMGAVLELPTAQAALLGRFERGPVDVAITVGEAEFSATYASATLETWPAEIQARTFFANGGAALRVVRVAPTGTLAEALTGRATDLSGLHALTPDSDLSLLVAPELSLVAPGDFASALASFGQFLTPRRILLLLDPPPGLATPAAAGSWVDNSIPTGAAFCATYYPYLQVTIDGSALTIPAGGAMAAILVRNDNTRGIWKSPAGAGIGLEIAADGLSRNLSDSEIALLSASNVNAIRSITGNGIVPWGARTLDRSDPDNRFIVVTRTRNWIAACIERRLAFAATRDNDTTLWTEIRSETENFLQSLYVRGAFVGTTPTQAYFARCDSTTVTTADVAAHRVNLLYGVALLRASEYLLTSLAAATYDEAAPIPIPAIHVPRIPGTFRLSYPTVPGFSYEVKSSTDLATAPWLVGAPLQTGDKAWRTHDFPMSVDRNFYRVRISPGR